MTFTRFKTQLEGRDANGVQLNAYNGQTVKLVHPIDPATYDHAEAGDMYLVRANDGVEFEAFSDELVDL